MQKQDALKHFAYDIRDIVRRQPLPGYCLAIERAPPGKERLSFKPSPTDVLTEGSRHGQRVRPRCGQPVNSLVPSGTVAHVPSGTKIRRKDNSIKALACP
jgi:hypothetical protein